MGQVKDVYFHQTQGGDEFVGRCVSLLNMMSGDFAASPVHFDDSVDADWIKITVGDVFPQFASVDGMEQILHRCLSSLVYHREKVLAFDPNHVARQIPIFRDLTKIEGVLEKLKIV